MERLCYRCNAPVAAGAPFCPQCKAPQIRVVAEAERAPERTADITAGAPVFETASSPTIHWSAALARTAAAAVASVALLQLTSVFHSAALAFLILPVGGWFAVYLYARRIPGPVSAGMGARLGAVTGFFIFALLVVMSGVAVVLDRNAVFEMMQKALKDSAAANPSPQADALLHQLSTPAGMMIVLFLAAVMFLFASLVLCSIGGAAGAGLMNRDRN